MKKLIQEFPQQLRDALQIAASSNLEPADKTIRNVLITGLGGSGIGGKIVADILKPVAPLPICINNDYHIPAFVNNETLVIVSSYSGNTEETLSAMEEAIRAGAEVACITSGGKVAERCKEKGLNYIVVPGGNPPRACLGYSLVQQFRLLHHYGVHNLNFKDEILKSIELIESESNTITERAKQQANRFKGKIPVIYAGQQFEGVVTRLRQQINENSKELCWHHVLPEMNHNELVGWGGGDSRFEVLILRSEDDYDRTSVRMDISMEVISKKANITEIEAHGDSTIQRAIYLINYGDWVSWYLSEIKGVDAIEIDIINHLKGELAKL